MLDLWQNGRIGRRFSRYSRLCIRSRRLQFGSGFRRRRDGLGRRVSDRGVAHAASSCASWSSTTPNGPLGLPRGSLIKAPRMTSSGTPYTRSRQAMREEDPRYWYWQCRALGIRWVVNVLSNILVAQGLPPIGDMTVRGRLKAAEIIGIGEAQS